MYLEKNTVHFHVRNIYSDYKKNILALKKIRAKMF